MFRQAAPQRRALEQDLVVKIIAGVMHHTAIGFISGADSEITPVRIMFEHKGKIFAAHKRFHLPDLRFAKQRRRHLAHHLIRGGIVFQHRTAVDVG